MSSYGEKPAHRLSSVSWGLSIDFTMVVWAVLGQHNGVESHYFLNIILFSAHGM